MPGLPGLLGGGVRRLSAGRGGRGDRRRGGPAGETADEGPGPPRAGACDGCAEGLERRFDRPGHAAALRTLGDAILELDRPAWVFFQEPDPEVLEVFPGLSDEVVHPRSARYHRLEDEVQETLVRVGGRAALFDRGGIEEGRGPFLVAEALEGGGGVGTFECYWREMFDFTGLPVAHEFAPDGSPLAGR